MQATETKKKGYFAIKRENFSYGLKKAGKMKVCYLFLLPYALLFFTFFILPIATSIFYSFTYYNILELRQPGAAGRGLPDRHQEHLRHRRDHRTGRLHPFFPVRVVHQ